MNPKLQKVNREIERTRERIAELQTLLPELEATRTKLENAEVIKAFRSVDVAPAEFSAFIEAYRIEHHPQANDLEEIKSDEV